MNLADYVENISDDFQSTFTVVNANTLANLMGLPGDFEKLTEIISRYIPGAKVVFSKTDELGSEESYDVYLVTLHKTSGAKGEG